MKIQLKGTKDFLPAENSKWLTKGRDRYEVTLKRRVCMCVCVFPFLLLLAGNYIKGALFQGPSPLNVIKHNLLSVVASCVSFFWGQPAPLRSSAASLPFCPDSSSNQSSKHDMLMARNSLDIIISCTLNLPNNCSFIKHRSPKHLLTSRWSWAAIGKRGMQCFM